MDQSPTDRAGPVNHEDPISAKCLSREHHQTVACRSLPALTYMTDKYVYDRWYKACLTLRSESDVHATGAHARCAEVGGVPSPSGTCPLGVHHRVPLEIRRLGKDSG
jgi:hypothetical protein